MTQQVKSVCPYCGVGCGIVMEVADGRIVKVAGDKSHPANFGRLCTKGSTSHLPVSAIGRADRAYARIGGSYDQGPVPIEEAIRKVATGLRTIIERDGPDAVSFYVSGQMSLEAQYLANKLCKGFIGTNNIESNSRLCMASAASGYKLSLGADGPPGSYQDFDKADLFLVIGANMADCHPILFLRMMDRVKAGAKLIVVDPRRNGTAEKADLFLQIKPGTDLALLNGLLHLLVAEDRIDRAFIANHTEGWDEMPAFLEDYDPASVSRVTGLAEHDLRLAAQMIGTAGEWMTCWTMGLNQSSHGTWNTNAICNLHLATGAICRPGSGPFSLTGQPNAMGGREMGYMGPGLPGQRTVVSAEDRRFVEDIWGLPEGALWAEAGTGTVDMFERMAAGDIKACWIICTNPVASVANRRAVMKGLEACELVIAQDAYLDTETNRLADIILPAALWAEAEGVMVNSERNLTLMQKAVEPPGEALPDWEIIARVAREMGYGEAFPYTTAGEVFEEIRRFHNPATGYDLRGVDHVRLRQGPVQWPCPPDAARDRNPTRYRNDGSSQTLRVEADGSVPALAFPTVRGKAFFLARPHVDPAEVPDADFPFVLNTGRLQHQWHTLTKTGKVAALNKLNPGPFVELHPDDARGLGISDRDQVAVRSRRGSAVLPATVTERVRPGNCFAPFHWNDVFGEQLAINAVTNDAVDPISRQPEFKYCAVQLERVSGPVDDDEPVESTSAHAATGAAPAFGGSQALELLLGPAIARPELSEAERRYLAGFVDALARTDLPLRPGVPVLPPSAPFAEDHRTYVDGLLAGIYSRAEARAGKMLVLWASQTGRAESLAISCCEALGSDARQACLSEVKPADVAAAGEILFIVSTFGDGEPPDNGAAFWMALAAEDAPPMDGVGFAVLALGDSSYSQFCGFGRKLDARLEELGGRRLVARADCEPDYEETADAWLDEVRFALAVTHARVATARDKPPPAVAGYGRKTPFTSRLATNRLLSGSGSQKEVRQFGFDIAGSGIAYAAGDALGVWPVNHPDLVAEILETSGIDADTPVSLKAAGEVAIADALLRHCEIGRQTANVVTALATAGRVGVLSLDVNDGATGTEQGLRGKQLADVLREMKGTWDAQALVDALRPTQPRLYSISSSPRTSPEEIQLTVSVVRYDCSGRRREGICSGYLADRAAREPPRIFVQPSTHFRPPADPDSAMIMIGPGTGIAPFRGFLQDREATGAKGRNWLFFGEQRAACDFYYRDELETWCRAGHLARLDLAFSRDASGKTYVQHRMMESGAELWRWIEEGAHLYVCGDATRMAKDVDATLKVVAARHGGMSADTAEAYVSRLSEAKRYVRDVY